jgi:membrane complex biogenesis BtpA family protein
MIFAPFSVIKPVIGMIHVGALPGTPAHTRSVAEITAEACREARLYREAGIDALVIENMHDVPYLRGRVGPEIVAAMAVIGRAVREESRLAVGLQILAGANLEAMGVAAAAGLDFIRVEGYAFAHVADEGIIEASAGELLRYRKAIGAEGVRVWADVKKKHSSHAITSDISLAATVEAVEFMRGDAVIITGTATGDPPRLSEIAEAKTVSRLPVLLGSGVTPENLTDFYFAADGFIIGSSFKIDGRWSNAVDPARVDRVVKLVGELRRTQEK